MKPVQACRAAELGESEEIDNGVRMLVNLASRGVELWLENGRLHIRSPHGVLDKHEVAGVRAGRDSLIELIDRTIGDLPSCSLPDDDIAGDAYAPLASTQLAHWRLFRLSERRSVRQLVSALHLHGSLDIGALEESISDLAARHDALRTRIISKEGLPFQEVRRDFELCVREETLASKCLEERHIVARIRQFLLEPVDLSSDSPFAAQLLRISHDHNVLVLAMEHVIADAVSLNIALNELLSIYAAKAGKVRHRLPPVHLQFSTFARNQVRARPDWIRRNTIYWAAKTGRCARMRLPRACTFETPCGPGWGNQSVQIRASLRAELMRWCKRSGTTLVLGALTAYCAVIGRHYETTEIVIQCMTNGRRSDSAARAIGYFASPVYLRVEVRPFETLAELNRRVMKEYAEAFDHADDGWMEARTARPEFTRNPGFNWVVQGSNFDLHALDPVAGRIECAPIALDNPFLRTLERDNEPVLVLYDSPADIGGGVFFPLNRFSESRMQSLAKSFVEVLSALALGKGLRNIDVPVTS